jgi:vacuolar-type H+-ATPase subunit F/Vma7
MSRVAAIGRPSEVAGFGLAGALVLPARTEGEARAAWAGLPADVAVVVLTAQTAKVLEDAARRPRAPLTVVMPT